MSNWKLIIPESTTNLFDDPSFFLSDPDTEWDISGDGAAPDWTRSTAQSMFGVSSALADVDAGGGGTLTTIYQSITTTATSYTLSAYVRRSAGGTLTNSQCVAWFDDGAQNWDSITQVNEYWYYCVYTGTATAAANQFGVRALEDGLYVDACQLENKAYATTYCDGNQEGCEWEMAPFTSNSTRSAQARAGGRVRDLADDFSFYVTGWTGFGMPPVSLGVDEYAIAPGGQLNSVKIHDVEIVLIGELVGTSLSNYHSLRQDLIDDLAPDRYPKTAQGWQPFVLRYTGATTHKEIRVHYAGGLEGSRGPKQGYAEKLAIRLSAPEPGWKQVGYSSAVLDSNDTATLRYLSGRLRSTGQWDDLGLTNDPTANGTIWTIHVASDGSVYFGGNFDGINNNSPAGSDYVIRFDPSDESWNLLVGASDVNGIVWDIVEGPDGTIYLCGAFTAVDGQADQDYIVSYDPSADTWSNLGDPDSGAAAITACYGMAFDSSGNLYVVGDFENFNDVAAADYVAKWDGSSWAAVGAPNPDSNDPTSIAIDSQDNVVVSGGFTDFLGDGSDYNYIARWNGSAWSDLGSGTQSGTVSTLAFGADDTLYLGGSFTDQGGEADCDYICAWNGRQFLPMVGGATAAVTYDIAIAPDGRIFAAGMQHGSGSISSWNGAAWEIWDSAADNLRCLSIGQADSTISTSYDIWIGENASSSTEIAGSTTVTNNGIDPCYPVFQVTRSGGTSASLYTLFNETTGQRLMFDYALQDGETLVVDCRPDSQSITSYKASASFNWNQAQPQTPAGIISPQPSAMIPGSDLGTFTLQPGSNQITCFVDVAGAPTITATLEWKESYRGAD